MEALFPQWRDDNEHSKYPFTDSSSLIGGREFGKDFILDMSLYPVGGNPPAYLSRVIRDTETVTLAFSDSGGEIGQCGWEVGAFSSELSLAVIDPLTRNIGMVILSTTGRINLEGWDIGEYAFESSAAEIVPTCFLPQPQIGLRGFLLKDGDYLSGDTVMVGGAGVWLSNDSGKLRVDITGDFAQFKEKCQGILPSTISKFVKTINGQPPDENGNFLITPSNQPVSEGGTGNKPIFRVQLQPPSTLIITAISDK